MKNYQDQRGLSSIGISQLFTSHSRDLISSVFHLTDAILHDASLVFEDVNEDFGSVDGVLGRFLEWKEEDLHSYTESYTSICVPKCLAPYIKLELLAWDPLAVSN
jgi:hypothetical protein